LRERGPDGVGLVISDQHRGLVNTVQAALQRAAWRRRRLHFLRNVLAASARARL
jgi:putative transposase